MIDLFWIFKVQSEVIKFWTEIFKQVTPKPIEWEWKEK